nr:hypothetical protein CFP56_30528 [Quercus suber]
MSIEPIATVWKALLGACSKKPQSHQLLALQEALGAGIADEEDETGSEIRTLRIEGAEDEDELGRHETVSEEEKTDVKGMNSSNDFCGEEEDA